MTRNEVEIKKAGEDTAPTRRSGTLWSYRPNVDVLDSDDAIIVQADMPGTNPEKIDINYEDGRLSIHGRVTERRRGDVEYLAYEYGIGDYERTFTVSNEIDRDGIEASMSDGVLRLKLPKAKQAVERKIKVSGT